MIPVHANFWKRPFQLLFLSGWIWSKGQAQQPLYLKPQPHKLLYADTVYRESLRKNDSLLLAEAYYLYGKTYDATGDHLTAQRWLLKSLRILEPRGDSFELSRLYNRLSGTQENYREMKRYAFLAVAVARRIHSDKALMRAYSTLINIYQGDWSEGGRKPNLPGPMPDSTVFYLKSRHYLAHKLNDQTAIMGSYTHWGEFIWRTYHSAGAIPYFKKALALATKQKEDGLRIANILALATTYTALRQPKPVWALLAQGRQIRAQTPINDHYMNMEFERAYMGYYQLVGDWKRTYEHSQKLHAMEIGHYVADRDGAIARLGIEYKSEQKEALLRAQRKELFLRAQNLLIQQRFSWAVSILLLVTAAMSVIFFRLYRKNQRISQQNAELVKEQNHRVKNNLQVVSSLLSLQSNRLTDEMARKAVEESQLRVQTMAILHRRLYDGDQLARVSLPDFVMELVESAFLTFGYASLDTSYAIDPLDLPADQAVSIGLIINELATNACKYAFPDHPNPAFRVACHQSGHRIELSISDNGPGFLPTVSGSPGNQPPTFGLRLIQMQVEQLRGQYLFTCENGSRFIMKFNY